MQKQKKQILIPIANGVEEIETIILIDIFRRAGAEVTVASVNELKIVSAHNVTIIADCLIEECKNMLYDLIVLPGGSLGAENLRDCLILKELLEKQKKSGRLYGAICASPVVVLAHHNLINDVVATAYPSLMHKLPLAADEGLNVVFDKNCITSKAPGTAFPFALEIVEILYGKDKAGQLSKEIVI